MIKLRFAKYDHGVSYLQVQNEEGKWEEIPTVTITNETLENDPVIGGPVGRISRQRLKELQEIQETAEESTTKKVPEKKKK